MKTLLITFHKNVRPALCLMLACCNTNSKVANVEQNPEVCEVHQANLKTREGFSFNDGMLADPSWDYVRFMDEERYPHATPWGFFAEQNDHASKPTKVIFCPICDAEFEKGYEKFRRLSEEEKEAAFVDSLRREQKRREEHSGKPNGG